MERTETFPALTISTLHIRLTTAALTVVVDEVPDIQVEVSGEHPASITIARHEGTLRVRQSLHPLRRVSQVIVRLPMDWKGAADGCTLTGDVNASGLIGTDLRLRSLTGGVYAESLSGITAHLGTLSGPIGASDLVCERCSVRTLTGQVVLSALSMNTGKFSALHSRAEADLAGAFEAFSTSCLFGSMTVYAPMDQADAAIASLRGQLKAEGITAVPGAPRIGMKSVTADFQLICSLDNQAMLEEQDI